MKNGNFVFVGGFDGLETLAERERQWEKRQAEEEYYKMLIRRKLGEEFPRINIKREITKN